MKLWLYPSEDRTKCIIILRKYKCNYQMILWNIKNNIFEEGQWLTKRNFCPYLTRVSPDCSLIAHQFSYYNYLDYHEEIVLSKPPYFTSLIYGFSREGRSSEGFRFTKDNSPLISIELFEKIFYDTDVKVKNIKDVNTKNIYQEGGELKIFIDCFGRKITTKEGLLITSTEEILKDFSENKFSFVKTPESYF